MKLEEAIQTKGFKSQKEKAALNIMFRAYQIKTSISLVLKDYGLTPEQYNVLRILKGKHPGPMCVKDIAGRVIERSSNLPRIIDRLELKKLVKRSPGAEDRRETAIALTQAGINMLAAVSPKLEQHSRSLTALPEAALQQLNDLLDQYLQP